jgi:hypothetical protein
MQIKMVFHALPGTTECASNALIPSPKISGSISASISYSSSYINSAIDKMSTPGTGSNMVEVVKEKVNGILAKYPVIDQPLVKMASKVGVDKAFVAIGICVLVPLSLSFFLSFGTLFM